MTKIQLILAAGGLLLLTGAMAADETTNAPLANQPSIQVGQWQCGVRKSSRVGYQCDVITFRPGFGATPQVFLSLSRLDLSAGSAVLDSVMVKVAQVSWSSFQPEVVATGRSDSTGRGHVEVHESGNWAGTWIAVGPPPRRHE